MQQTPAYRERSRAFLVRAREELAAGDLEQASEKAWGAAALAVKAVAERRGLEHRGHRHLHVVVQALAQESGDTELRGLLNTADVLHQNFYDGWLNVVEIGDDIDDVERFVEKVERLLR